MSEFERLPRTTEDLPRIVPASMQRRATDTVLLDGDECGRGRTSSSSWSFQRPSSASAAYHRQQQHRYSCQDRLDPAKYPFIQSSHIQPYKRRERWSCDDKTLDTFASSSGSGSDGSDGEYDHDHVRRRDDVHVAPVDQINVWRTRQYSVRKVRAVTHRRSSLKTSGSDTSTTCSSSLRRRSSSTGELTQQQQRRVCFSTVEIRSYESILGDNPSCSSGPPFSLGWRYDPDNTHVASVREYEASVASTKDGSSPKATTRAKSPQEMVLPRHYREAVLTCAGYTQEDIASAVRTCIKVKRQRRRTYHNLRLQRVEEVAERVGRRIRKATGQRRAGGVA